MHQTSRGASPHCISPGVNYSSLFQTRVSVLNTSASISTARFLTGASSFFFFSLSLHPPQSQAPFASWPRSPLCDKDEGSRRKRDEEKIRPFAWPFSALACAPPQDVPPYIIPGFPHALRSAGIALILLCFDYYTRIRTRVRGSRPESRHSHSLHRCTAAEVQTPLEKYTAYPPNPLPRSSIPYIHTRTIDGEALCIVSYRIPSPLRSHGLQTRCHLRAWQRR